MNEFLKSIENLQIAIENAKEQAEIAKEELEKLKRDNAQAVQILKNFNLMGGQDE